MFLTVAVRNELVVTAREKFRGRPFWNLVKKIMEMNRVGLLLNSIVDPRGQRVWEDLCLQLLFPVLARVGVTIPLRAMALSQCAVPVRRLSAERFQESVGFSGALCLS